MDSLKSITELIIRFRDERDWKQFHSPRNLAASISVEAAELLALYRWLPDDTADPSSASKQEIAHEMADVAIGLLELANDLGINLGDSILSKLELNGKKYPVEKARGSNRKYDRL
jgi:dCTP diphosphatase